MIDNNLNIFFTIDENYVQHFTVTLTSIVENNDGLNIKVYVISDISNNQRLIKSSAYFREKYGINIQFIKVDPRLFETFMLSEHISKATYFRLLISEILPKEICEGLFIDSDIVVTGSLRPLMEKRGNEDFLLKAASEGHYENVLRLNSLGYQITDYFNAGVMYLNIERWRNEGIAKKLMEVAESQKDNLLWWDQDVLNMFFSNKWVKMPYRYNATDIKESLDAVPVVIHFTGSTKPWDYYSVHPYKFLYLKYLRMTPFKNYNPFYYAIKNKIKKFKKGIWNVQN